LLRGRLGGSGLEGRPEIFLGFADGEIVLLEFWGADVDSFSEVPAAWMIGGSVGFVANEVLLNEGNSENAYSAVGVLRSAGR
jgi:hypothetical protein